MLQIRKQRLKWLRNGYVSKLIRLESNNLLVPKHMFFQSILYLELDRDDCSQLVDGLLIHY